MISPAYIHVHPDVKALIKQSDIDVDALVLETLHGITTGEIDSALGRENWTAPSFDRVALLCSHSTREDLKNALVFIPALRGVGYSEFLHAASRLRESKTTLN